MKLADIRTKYAELKADKLSSRIEWTEERPVSKNPTTEGLASGNIFPNNKYMLEQKSINTYMLYMSIDGIFVDVMTFTKEELEG